MFIFGYAGYSYNDFGGSLQLSFFLIFLNALVFLQSSNFISAVAEWQVKPIISEKE